MNAQPAPGPDLTPPNPRRSLARSIPPGGSAIGRFRPSRRSLLLGSAVAAPLVMAGCDGLPGGPEEEERPRAEIELAELAVPAALQASRPVLSRWWSISAGPDHPMALLCELLGKQGPALHYVTVDKPLGVTVPLDGEPSSFTIDAHGDAVRIYARTVKDGAHSWTMYSSADLQDWTITPLDQAIDVAVARAGGGILVSHPRDSALKVWDVAEDGTVSALEVVAVPEGQTWTVDEVTRSGETIVLLLTVPDDAGVDVPATVTSTDAGTSWSEAAPLPASGSQQQAGQLLTVNGGFAVIGRQRFPSQIEGAGEHSRPAAWYSSDGVTFTEEQIPLPTWGIDGFVLDAAGHDLTPETPMDFATISHGGVVRSVDGSSLHLLVYYGDDPRMATRSGAGEWTTSEQGQLMMLRINGGVLDPSGMLLHADNAVHVRTGDSETFEQGLDIARSLQASMAQGTALSGGAVATVAIPRGIRVRSESNVAWSSTTRFSAVALGSDALVVGRIPADPQVVQDLRIAHVAGDLTLVVGTNVDGNGFDVEGVHGWAGTGAGEWVPMTGFPESTVSLGVFSAVRDDYCLPVMAGDGEGESEGVTLPTIYSSADGISWGPRGEIDAEALSQDVAAGGVWVQEILQVEDAVVGIGHVLDAEDVTRAATMTLEGEAWRVHPMEGAEPGSYLVGASVVTGRVEAGLYGTGRASRVEVHADGGLTETYRAEETTRQDLPLDLGDGALIAAGWIDQPGTGIGDCVWASLDGGENWDATVIPGQEGRADGAELTRDGDDVVVLVEHPYGIRGFRIRSAAADVLGDPAASDGGGASDGGS